MSTTTFEELEKTLEEIRSAGLYKEERVIAGPQGAEITLTNGQRVLNFCANNYLGLSSHPRVIAAAHKALDSHGYGMSSVRFICGTQDLHKQLEAAIARFLRVDDAILYAACFDANGGVFEPLLGEEDAIVSDELNHASIIDGCRLARAETFVYRHGDVDHLSWGLRKAGERAALIVTDGVFSMDGDVAPLADLAALAQRHGCRLMVDEAHATGALGPGGRGSVAAAGLSGEVDVVIGTLGKALGSYGAYACANRETIDYLLNTARSFVFSTAPPPPAAAAAMAALEVLESQPERVDKLAANAATLRRSLAAEGLAVGSSDTQIVPIEAGEAAPTMALCERILEQGVFAQGIRPPTVPEGSSRLRFTVMSTHRREELERAAKIVGAAARELGIATGADAAVSQAVAA
jgi:glycine C-acetyltransferase